MISNCRIQLLIVLAVISTCHSSFAQEAEPADDGISVPELEAPVKSARKPSSSAKSHFVDIQSDFPEEELGTSGEGASAPDPAN